MQASYRNRNRMSSIFSRIIAGEIPAYRVAENDRFIAFLDIFPLTEGHVLVVPKVEIDRFFDVPDNLLQEWLIFAKPIALAIEKAFPCNRCGICVMGLEVPHAHMHLLPLNSEQDINFSRPRLKLDDHQLSAIRQRILEQLD